MENRRKFLESKLETTNNNFNLKIPITPEHRPIFDKVASSFRPAAKLTEDIKNLVTGDLNLCRDRNVLIYFRGNSDKLNTLKFYLLMNFLSNWKEYRSYVVNLVGSYYESNNNLTYETCLLQTLSEMRFRKEDNSKLNYYYNVDILFLIVSGDSRLFESDFNKELLGVILSLRNSLGLVTAIIVLNNNSFTFDSFDVPIKKLSLSDVGGSSTKQVNKNRNNNKLKINDEEVF